jgi:outer membrane receptor protein involved in Fe transport
VTRRLIVPLAAAAFALARTAFAQEPAPAPTPAAPARTASKPDADEMPERTYAETVVVTASKTAEEVRDAPVAVTVVPASEIEKSSAESHGDLLRTVPGLNVAQMSARDVNLTPRLATGRNANATLALLDGRTIYQDYFGMVLWDLLPIDFDEVKQVEVVRGPDSAMWGANAMGGVVNILTKDPAEMLGTSVKLGGGTLGTREAGVIHAGTSGAASYKVSASHRTPGSAPRRCPTAPRCPRTTTRARTSTASTCASTSTAPITANGSSERASRPATARSSPAWGPSTPRTSIRATRQPSTSRATSTPRRTSRCTTRGTLASSPRKSSR